MVNLIIVSESKSFKSMLKNKIDSLDFNIIEIESIVDAQINSHIDNIIIFDLQSINLEYSEFNQMIKDYGGIAIALTPMPIFKEGYNLLRLGIKGYINLHVSTYHFNNAINAILSGGTWFDPGFIQELINKISVETKKSINENSSIKLLTEKELQIANYVAKGESTKNISIAFSITERTVKAHIQACYKKLALNDRVSLALWAKENIDG